MITPQNIFRHEFIGLPVEVVSSSHEGYEGIIGRVVDETKNTIKIEDSAGNEKIIPKKVAIFHITLSDGTKVEIDGKLIAIRPENRIKKRYKKYW
ncbi:MAG: ribonuclease P protein component 1 [Methanothermobacter sp.]|jgi:ribonuclease P protein subunit POP4